jgi:hypothetical protein
VFSLRLIDLLVQCWNFCKNVPYFRLYLCSKKKQRKTNAKLSSCSTNIYIENLYVCASSGIILSRFSSKIPHAVVPCLTYLQVQKCIISVTSTILQRTLQTPLSSFLGHLVVILTLSQIFVKKFRVLTSQLSGKRTLNYVGHAQLCTVMSRYTY